MCPLQQQQQQPSLGAARRPCGHLCMSFTSLSAYELFPKCLCGGGGLACPLPHFVLKTLHSLVTPSRGSPTTGDGCIAGVSGARREASQVETSQGLRPCSAGWLARHPRATHRNIILCCQYCPPQPTSRMYTTKFLYLMTCMRGTASGRGRVTVEGHDLDKKHLPYIVCLWGVRHHHRRPHPACRPSSDFLCSPLFVLLLQDSYVGVRLPCTDPSCPLMLNLTKPGTE